MKGLGTALITPFLANGEVDYNALGKLVEYQISGGTDYLVLLGTTSEVPTLTVAEQDAIIDYVIKKVAGRIPLVMGIGGNCTKAVVERINNVKDTLKAHFAGILSVVPYYNRPQQEGLYQHFCAVAQTSPVPVILYNVPKRTGVNMLPETTRRIYDACPDKIVGIKEACNSVEQFAETVRLANGHFSVISGDDDLACEMMKVGGAGLISVASNAWPAEMKQIVTEKDAIMQAKMGHNIHLLFVEGNPSGIKTVLAEMGMIENVLRLPMIPCSENTQKVIRRALAQG
jgi:4-hydroxy-tetrahydrodipicolinate synthase